MMNSGPPIRQPVHGWLILDKPQGLTSTQSLGKARRLLSGKKAGHGGTLDPLATGILPLAFGEATKLIPYVMDGDKEYEFTVRWGEQRDTDDAEGQVVAISPVRPSEAAIQAALAPFIGLVNQTPPRYSAIKIDGERAYDLAREGVQVAMQPRQVTIYDLKLIDANVTDEARFWVASGKGMYVRSLARDLAASLGTCGHVTALRRLRVGPFTLTEAISLEKLTELAHNGAAHKALLALRMALDDIPVLHLTASEAQRLRAGQSLMIRPQHMDLVSAPVIWAEHQGTPVALVAQQSGAFHVMRGFHF
jgi:tRNA pseudouridine55 synthase